MPLKDTLTLTSDATAHGAVDLEISYNIVEVEKRVARVRNRLAVDAVEAA